MRILGGDGFDLSFADLLFRYSFTCTICRAQCRERVRSKDITLQNLEACQRQKSQSFTGSIKLEFHSLESSDSLLDGRDGKRKEARVEKEERGEDNAQGEFAGHQGKHLHRVVCT